MTNKAYINILAEEGTREDLIYWIIKLDEEVDYLKKKLTSTYE